MKTKCSLSQGRCLIFQKWKALFIGFLRRNLAFAPRQTKEAAYKTLVRPQLEFASPVWHHYLKTQTQQIKKVPMIDLQKMEEHKQRE